VHLHPPCVYHSRSLLVPPRRLGEELGRGAFGQVYLGLDTRTGQHVAIKQLSLERIPTDSLQARCRPGCCAGCVLGSGGGLEEGWTADEGDGGGGGEVGGGGQGVC
jgi:hypothetical protein